MGQRCGTETILFLAHLLEKQLAVGKPHFCFCNHGWDTPQPWLLGNFTEMVMKQYGLKKKTREQNTFMHFTMQSPVSDT